MSEMRNIVRQGSLEFLEKLMALSRAMSNEHVDAGSAEIEAIDAAIDQLRQFIDGMDEIESDEELRDRFSSVVEALMPAIQNAIEARKRLGVRQQQTPSGISES